MYIAQLTIAVCNNEKSVQVKECGEVVGGVQANRKGSSVF